MCGIAGILRFDHAPIRRDELARMAETLAHRGPDGAGFEVLGACGLAHRRLSIIDLSEAGHQPMCTGDRKLWITYNGEVYNYVELRAELEKLGHSFRSRTDTEVILAAYRQWGEDAFSRFNGMWAIALFDVDAERLVLSRDRFGVKPLVFHRNAHRLLFASEAKAILAAEPALARPDMKNVARLLIGSGYAFEHTFFEGIEVLEPASLTVIDRDGRTRKDRFWTFRPPERPVAMSLSTAAERVRETLIDAVRIRFRSDVPVGTCLSGGLDSSSIVSIAGRMLGEHPHSFTAVYEQPGFSEGDHARLVVKEFGLQGNEVAPDGRDVPDVLERATYFQDGPTGGPGIYSQWHVMKLAHGRVKVLLDGQGGDELFAGYFSIFPVYFDMLFSRARRGDLAALAEIVRSRASIRALTGIDPVPLGRWKSRLRNEVRRRSHKAYRLLRKLAPAIERKASPPIPTLPTRELQSLIEEERYAWTAPRTTGDAVTDTLWDQTVRTSIPALLHYEDRDSMAFSIEARVPFLDYRLVELAFQIPTHFKVSGDSTKVVLREAMRGILPEAIRQRRDKLGYPTPLGEWLSGLHREWLIDIASSAKKRGIFDEMALETTVRDHLEGRRDASWVLHQIITLELFFRTFIDRPFTAKYGLSSRAS